MAMTWKLAEEWVEGYLGGMLSFWISELHLAESNSSYAPLAHISTEPIL
jgi:hypothetical protein